MKAEKDKKLITFLIAILAICLIFLVFVLYNQRIGRSQEEDYFDVVFDIPTIRRQQEETSQQLFGSKLETCKSIPITNSQGLILDSSIVCNATKTLSRQPMFYYEIYPENSDPDGYFFVNFDLTDFQKLLADPKSPKNILCKTRQCYDILSRLLPYKNIIYTGFTSVDRNMISVSKNYRSYIHIAGKSPYKGTLQVVRAWIKHPEWPVLTLICREEILEVLKPEIKKTANIHLISEFLSEQQLIQYMNQNGIHICPSKHEGFGHYINEARSTEAVVLYTNAPPMNEMFQDGINGIAISAVQDAPTNNGICPTYLVYPESIEEAVVKTLNMSVQQLATIGKNARAEFLKNDEAFKKRLLDIFH